MAWVYHDESGEYDAKGKLINLTMGCCVSTAEKWRHLEEEWRTVLSDHGVALFHMSDFEAWRPPYDFKRADGERDYEKHNKILNFLLDLVIENVEGIHGYASTSILREGDNAHREYFEDCVIGAVKDAVLETWRHYEEPLNLVFDRQNHFPESGVKKYVTFYDFGEASDRVGSFAIGKSHEIVALQAADLIAFEMSKYQRLDRAVRYPFERLQEAAKNRKFRMTLAWGPLRHRRINLGV
jgi:hypothetical protein